MTCLSKRKIKIKEQERDNNERFAKKPYIVNNWEDKDDSRWDDEVDLLSEKEDKCKLVWSNNAEFKQKKHGPYLAEKTKKSTYFDKYGSSGSFIKVAEEISKISMFFKKNQSTPEDFEKVLNDMEDEGQN